MIPCWADRNRPVELVVEDLGPYACPRCRAERGVIRDEHVRYMRCPICGITGDDEPPWWVRAGRKIRQWVGAR